MNNPAMSKELGQAGRRRIEEHFSTTVVAARLEHFYRQLPGIQTGN
jgi:glycosyltransferase involved in cell wall biosynthesis